MIEAAKEPPSKMHIKYGDKYLMHYQGRPSPSRTCILRFGFARQHQEAIDANESLLYAAILLTRRLRALNEARTFRFSSATFWRSIH